MQIAQVSAKPPPGRTMESAPRSVPDDAFQTRMLEGVSRTFALTIPQLPAPLARVVANAYLLCRIIDTIEDEPGLATALKRSFCQRFCRALRGEGSPARFAADLSALLSPATPPLTRELIAEVPRVLAITAQFNARQQAALVRCVMVMAEGMIAFQENRGARGLRDLDELARYCYHVAGVVGEMLTELFCDYSPHIDAHRPALMALSVSFGQGLQMTNILKDMWEDLADGACWLPRSVFAEAGYDLQQMDDRHDDPAFAVALRRLIGIANGHLEQALRYTLLIPREETGIRNFCLWAIGMAVLTLRKIAQRPGFRNGREVKISRRQVYLTIAASRLAARHDRTLDWLFRQIARGLPFLPQRAP